MVERVLWANQALPECRVAGVLLYEFWEDRLADLATDHYVVERGDDIEHRAWSELPGEPLRLTSHIVWRRAGVEH